MALRHRITINVTDPQGKTGTILKGADVRLPARLIRFLFGDFTHVETVVLLSDKMVDGYIDIDLDVEKLEGKSGTATYAEIKKYVADHMMA